MADPGVATGGEGLREQLLRAGRGSVPVRVAALGLTFASSVVLARALGADGYGVYAFGFALVNLLSLPSQAGLPTLLVRETAKWQALGQWAKVRGLWSWSSRVILVTSLGAAAAAAVVLWWLSGRIDRDTLLTLVAGLALMPLLALGIARGAAMRGLRLIVRGQLPETIFRPLFLVLLVGGAWLAGWTLSPQQAMSLHVAAAAAAFAIGALLLWRSRPAELVAAGSDVSVAPEWRRAVLPLSLITGLQVVANQSGIVLLGLFRPDAEAGLFKIAVSAAGLGLFGLQTVNLIIGPYLARLHALGDMARIRKLAGLGSLAGVAMTLPFFLAFLFFGRDLIRVVYGAAYVDAYGPLVVVSAAQMVNAWFGSVGVLLHMGGKERDASRWLVVSTTLNLLVGLAFIPAFGALGAAFATAAGVIAWNLAFWVVARREVGIDGSVFSVLSGLARK